MRLSLCALALYPALVHARLWEAFPEPQNLVDRVKAEVPRCFTPEQRESLFLAPTPPRWCAAMHKWPYDGATP